MRYELFDCDIRDGIARLTLLGPGNPILADLCDEFMDIMLRLQDDRAVRAVLITDGEHAFDLQHDFVAMRPNTDGQTGFANIAAGLEVAQKLLTMLQDCTKPVVTATRGDIRAIGLGFFMASNVRLASTTASFTAPDLTIGLMPEWGLLFTLPKALGPGRALEFLWSGRTLTADEAYAAGLVDRVIDDDSWDEAVDAFMLRVAQLPQPQIRLTMMAAQQSGQLDLTSMLSFEFEAQLQCWDSRESAECLSAWQQNRRPSFQAPLSEEDEQ
jgi:enoyl-CoA hydratase/carnithine racemase